LAVGLRALLLLELMVAGSATAGAAVKTRLAKIVRRPRVVAASRLVDRYMRSSGSGFRSKQPELHELAEQQVIRQTLTGPRSLQRDHEVGRVKPRA
jgi:hypothetical protein